VLLESVPDMCTVHCSNWARYRHSVTPSLILPPQLYLYYYNTWTARDLYPNHSPLSSQILYHLMAHTFESDHFPLYGISLCK